MIPRCQSSTKKGRPDKDRPSKDNALWERDGSHDGWPVMRRHPRLRLALHRIFDDRREPLGLALGTLLLALLELRQHFLAEQIERAADVLMLVFARLRNEHHLIDADLFVLAQARANLLGRADTRGVAAEPGHLHRAAFEIAPNVGFADFVAAEEIMMTE